MKCLRFANADIVGKEAILKELSKMDDNGQSQDVIQQLKGWQEVFYSFQGQFGWKKFFQAIPVAGIVFGAFANKSMIETIAETGSMLYRKRRVQERLKKLMVEENK